MVERLTLILSKLTCFESFVLNVHADIKKPPASCYWEITDVTCFFHWGPHIIFCPASRSMNSNVIYHNNEISSEITLLSRAFLLLVLIQQLLHATFLLCLSDCFYHWWYSVCPQLSVQPVHSELT